MEIENVFVFIARFDWLPLIPLERQVFMVAGLPLDARRTGIEPVADRNTQWRRECSGPSRSLVCRTFLGDGVQTSMSPVLRLSCCLVIQDFGFTWPVWKCRFAAASRVVDRALVGR